MKKITTLLLLTLVSCGAMKENIISERIEILKPELNQKSNSEIGETLIEKEIGYKYNAIKVNKSVTSKTNYVRNEIKVGEILINDSQTKSHFLYTCENNKYGIAFSKKDGTAEMFVNSDGIHTFPINGNLEFEKLQVPVIGKEYFKQEFIYNGKVGSGLKFIYREFIDNTARPAFTQDLQYDLSESDIIGFKGLRIKVLNTSNTKIEYVVLNMFNK